MKSFQFVLGITVAAAALLTSLPLTTAHGAEPDAWRVDYRRPSGTGNGLDSQVDWWRADYRRPDRVGQGMDNQVDWWHVDDRRPAWYPSAEDTDGDGVADANDECPDTPMGAEVDGRGCPMDSDGDGVYDGLDRCPDTPRGAMVDAAGCPLDSDGDGVYDGLDQCPGTTAGAHVDETGCPLSAKEVELLDTGKLVLNNVEFEVAQAVLRPVSFSVLDEVGDILLAWPGLELEVGGHTDNSGQESYNLDLSERRAVAVRDYLVGRFPEIEGSQLTTRGYGETDPITSNATQEGRARNRRVEFTVLNPEVLRK